MKNILLTCPPHLSLQTEAVSPKFQALKGLMAQHLVTIWNILKISWIHSSNNIRKHWRKHFSPFQGWFTSSSNSILKRKYQRQGMEVFAVEIDYYLLVNVRYRQLRNNRQDQKVGINMLRSRPNCGDVSTGIDSLVATGHNSRERIDTFKTSILIFDYLSRSLSIPLSFLFKNFHWKTIQFFK